MNVDSRGGIVKVCNLNLSGRHAWVEKLPAIYSASSLKADILRGGGEILERFNQPCGPFDATRWMELPLNVQGCPVGDTTPTRQRLASAFGCR